MRRFFPLTAAAIVAACSLPAIAKDPTDAPKKTADMSEAKSLKVGDPAPALTIDKWVKGAEVPAFKTGQVYVVEFWATWCGPCVASMPHLSELQREYKDKITIIGVTSKDPRNSFSNVEDMVKEKGDTMGYTVAWDKARDTYKTYMEAAGQNGIPTSFVVDQHGKVAFIGHPMSLDFVLSRVVAGKWDPVEGVKTMKDAMKERKTILEKADEDPKGAMKALDEFAAKFPEFAKDLDDARYAMLIEAGDGAGAAPVGARIVDKLIAARNVENLNAFSWGIVDPESTMKVKDYDLAMKAAQKGVEFSNEKRADVIDTLARCYFVKGDRKKAIEWQKKAVAVGKDENNPQLGEIEATLKEYEGGSN